MRFPFSQADQWGRLPSHRFIASGQILLCLGLLLFAMGTWCPKVHAELSYAGSSSIGDHLLPVVVKAFSKKTGIAFAKIAATDSGIGFSSARNGSTTLGGLSRFLTQKELTAGLGNQVIGYDAVVVYVQWDNPVKNLSLAQVKGIFSGTIKNWNEVGGPEGPIMVVLKHKIEGGTYGQFQEVALGGGEFCKPGLSFPGHKENIDYVAGNPLGITLGALAFDEKVARVLSIDGVLPSRKALNQGLYPMARPYILVYREDDENKELAAFLEFVFSKEGQRIIGSFAVPVLEFE